MILDLRLIWPQLVIINGRPRHPQSQGLVERSNAVVQQILGKWQETNKTSDWPSGLGKSKTNFSHLSYYSLIVIYRCCHAGYEDILAVDSSYY